MIDKMRVIHSLGKWNEQDVEVAVLLDAHDNWLQVQLEYKDSASMIGNIYIGRVQKVLSNINAAFIEIDKGVMAYLSLEDAEHPLYTHKKAQNDYLSQGDELLVEIVKEPIKTKNAVCTCNLSFAQDDVILTTGKYGCGVSRKLSALKREEIKQHFPMNDDTLYGLVFRTSAENVSLESLHAQIEKAEEEFFELYEKAKHLTCFSVVKKREQFISSFLRQLPHEEKNQILEVVSEDEEKLAQVLSGFHTRIYSDKEYSLWKLYGIEHKLRELCQKKVWLHSGAYLIIEPTETLTVIDVNTGKNIKKKPNQEYFYEVNQEACKEIMRQLRLRNISGMILIDFINMKDKDCQTKLLSYLRSLSLEDPISVQVLDYTRLGLVEMTRKKVYAPLFQQLNAQKKDEYC